jgi:putative dimethyl sulfoxide reductase chaperone
VTDQARNDEPVQIAQARGAIYRLLSRCFYQPTPQLFEDIARGPSASLLQNLLTTFQVGMLDEMLAPAENGAPRSSAGDATLFESLKEEYDRLFEGPGHVQVPPYESVHRTDVPEIERGLLMGRATLDAKRRYAELGLAMAKGFTDLPDHIAVELEFMCYLCTKEAEAGGAARDGRFVKAQRDFTHEHLTQWLPDFCDKIVASSTVRFYRDLAKVTKAYVESEAADLLDEAVTGEN